MQAAPPVAVVCDGGAAWRAVQVLLQALAAASLAAWVAGHAGAFGPLQAVVAAAAAVLAGGRAWRAAAPQPRLLNWDGEHWRLGPAGDPGQVDVMIDLGRWLLLRHAVVAASRTAHWLPVSAAAAGPAWHGLRIALHARPAAPGSGTDSPQRQAG
jgi:hypothetical protein